MVQGWGKYTVPMFGGIQLYQMQVFLKNGESIKWLMMGEFSRNKLIMFFFTFLLIIVHCLPLHHKFSFCLRESFRIEYLICC